MPPVHTQPVNLQPTHVSLLPFVSEIDFDTVSSGDVINSHYPGVKFDVVPVQNTQGSVSADVFASDAYDQTRADSPPNVITVSQPPKRAGFDERSGAIRVTFSSPQIYVSIDVLPIIYTGEQLEPDPSALPYLSAFGQTILLPFNKSIRPPIGTKWIPNANNQDPQFTKVWQRIEFVSTSPTPDIYSVQFSSVWASGNGAPVFGIFDRLRFSHVLPLPATRFVG
jgi:hypothetical protein